MNLSDLFRDAWTILRDEGWITGSEFRSGSGWCLVGALGAARFRGLSDRDRQRITNGGHRTLAETAPFAVLLHEDQMLRDATAFLFNLHFGASQGYVNPGNYNSVKWAGDQLMHYNDGMTGPRLIHDMLETATRHALRYERQSDLRQTGDYDMHLWEQARRRQQREDQRRQAALAAMLQPQPMISDEVLRELIESTEIKELVSV